MKFDHIGKIYLIHPNLTKTQFDELSCKSECINYEYIYTDSAVDVHGSYLGTVIGGLFNYYVINPSNSFNIDYLKEGEKLNWKIEIVYDSYPSYDPNFYFIYIKREHKIQWGSLNINEQRNLLSEDVFLF